MFSANLIGLIRRCKVSEVGFDIYDLEVRAAVATFIRLVLLHVRSFCSYKIHYPRKVRGEFFFIVRVFSSENARSLGMRAELT